MKMFTLSSGCCWKKFCKLISEQKPHDWLKCIVLIVCLIVVYQQIVECSYKLKNPPITTYSSLTINDSLYYPALTVCREPPYNKKVFPKFNFPTDHVGSFLFSSFWKYFPYEKYSISEFWDEAVYNQSVFSIYGLNNKNVNMTSSIHFQNGMCHTLKPTFPVFDMGKKNGYTLLLNHDLYDYKPLVDEEPGWKIYIHEPREKFSENVDLMSSRQDHVFVPVGETTEIAIDAYEFKVLTNCSTEENYSVTECEENCTINEDIIPRVPCVGPWLPHVNKPLCKNYDEMRVLLKAFYTIKNKNCCIKNCRTTYYKAFVVKRTPCPRQRRSSSTAMIYFSSKTIITMEEKFGYYWNDFLGEIGGSVGFLLGLSILGMIGILNKFIKFCFGKNDKKTTTTDQHDKKIFTIFDSKLPKIPITSIIYLT